MFNVLDDIDWLGALVAFVAFVGLGGLWFAGLFGKAYNRSLGRAADAKPVSTPLFLAGPPLTSLVITLTSAFLLAVLKVDAVGDAVVFGLIVGIGYLVANTVTIAINPNFPHPLRYALISGFYNVIGSVLVSILLVAV